MDSHTAAGQLAELARPFTSYAMTGHYDVHRVEHDSLVNQLQATATLTSSPAGGEGGKSGYGSRPAGRLDALTLLDAMDGGSAELAHDLGLNLPASTTLPQRLQAIAAELGAKGVEHHAKVNSWWARARVYVQLDGPAYTPYAVCPVCAVRGSLRVRLEDRCATCQECASVWTPQTSPSFVELAEWVEWSNDHLMTGHSCDECAHVRARLASCASRAARV